MKKLHLLALFLWSATAIAQVTVTTLTTDFKGSGGLSLDEEGNLYIADFGDLLSGPDPDGIPNHIMKLDTSLNLTQFSTGFIGASGNGFDNNGTLYQSDIRDNAIYKIVNGVRTFVTSTGIISPVGIVFDSHDNFYVCNCGNGTIQKVTPTGDSSIFASGSEFACPNGITVDEDDNLYVSNFSNTNIVKITPNGTTSIIGNTSANNGHLDYDPNYRKLYIASYAGNQILTLDIDTLEMLILAGTGVRGNDDGAGEVATFSTPNGVAISEDGTSIYINCAVPLSGTIINPQIIRLITLNSFGVSESKINEYQITAHPNPAHNTITIESKLLNNLDEIRIKIVTLDGRLLEEKNLWSLNRLGIKESFDISNLSSGSYFYSVTNKTDHLFTGKFVKN